MAYICHREERMENDNEIKEREDGLLPLVLGIVSVVMTFSFSRLVGLVTGILAIVFGRSKKSVSEEAKAGFVMGIIGTVFSGIFFGIILTMIIAVAIPVWLM